MALVVDGHDEEQRQQDGRNEYTAQGRADEVKTALDEAVPLAGQVIPQGQHEDLFAYIIPLPICFLYRIKP